MVAKEKIKKFIDLFLISVLALFFEILFIRWIPSNIQIIAYFANIILISAFLGLGLGCLLAQIKFDLMHLFPFLIFNMVVLLMGLNQQVKFEASGISGEHLLGFYGPAGVNFLIILAIVFIFNALIFIPLGQKLGSCLNYFKPLIAYSINIGGSIMGVAVFSLLSYLMLAPFYWFFGLFAALWFFISSKRNFCLQSLIVILTLFVVAERNIGSYWSPYYKIDIAPLISRQDTKPFGLFISANNTHHQYAYNLSDKSVKELPGLKRYRDIYEFPYNFVHPRNVLILGAGSGNDAAAALRRGIKGIIAVEIDPFIASIGKNLHEEKPYLSKNVHLAIDDARSFIKKADNKFDLITFGYLDAHKVLSQFSSVRLDNFIYTQESFRDIKEHLSQNGMLSLTYLVFREWIGAKLYTALKEVFGEDLKVFRTTSYGEDDTVIFLAGPAVKNIRTVNIPDFKLYGGFDKNAQFITDDWPYLYLTQKGIPSHYILILALVMAVSYVSIFWTGVAPLNKFNPHFFFLGSGFMLLETVGITRFALLFGSTWMVNSAVIISILIMVLLANLYAAKIKRINIGIIYLLLFSSIFLNWLLKPDFYLLFSKTLSIVLSSFALSLPMLFASIIFANSFRDAKDVSAVFAYNLLGAIVGGFCEYISMATGFRFLFIVAILMYYLSYRSLKVRIKAS